MKGVYEHTVRLYYNDFDMHGNIKMSSILHFLSDVAGIAYTSYGYSHDWLWENGQVFLLSQFRIKMLGELHMDEYIKVSTWEIGTKGAEFLRNFAIQSEDGTLIVEASSTWLLVNPNDRKILRPKDFIAETFPVQLKFQPALPKRLKYDPEKLVFDNNSLRMICFSDLDQNQHVYNAKYADMVYDILPEQYTNHMPNEFQIQYKQEAVLGENMRIGYEKHDEGVTVVGILENGKVSFIAELCVTP